MISFQFPPFFILPIGFIAFPYLFFLLSYKDFHNKNKFKQFIYGTVFGLGINLVLLNWVKEPFLFDTLTEKLSPLSYLFIFYVSIYFGLIFVILSFFNNKFSKLILIPAIFVVTEILRENIWHGFPWITFALIASSNNFYLNVAYYIGSYGLSFLTISSILVYILSYCIACFGGIDFDNPIIS